MKSIVAVAIASLLLVSPAFAYDPPPCAPSAPDVSGLSRGLQRAVLWSWVLSFAPETLNCDWLCWAFAQVRNEMPQIGAKKDYPPRVYQEAIP